MSILSRRRALLTKGKNNLMADLTAFTFVKTGGSSYIVDQAPETLTVRYVGSASNNYIAYTVLVSGLKAGTYHIGFDGTPAGTNFYRLALAVFKGTSSSASSRLVNGYVGKDGTNTLHLEGDFTLAADGSVTVYFYGNYGYSASTNVEVTWSNVELYKVE